MFRYFRNSRSSWRVGQVGHPRDVRLRQRLFQIVLHRLHDGQKLGMADAEARAKLHPLAVGGLADAVMDELVGHFGGERRAMRLRDQVQHHVERGGAAGTGHPRAVDLEQIVRDVEFGEFLAQPVDIFPVDGAAPVFKKACRRHDIGAGADGADDGAVPIQTPHKIEDVAIGVLANIQPGADKHHAAVLKHRRVAIGRHLDAVAGHGRHAARAGDDPVIEMAVALPVGGTKRLDRRGKGKHRKIVEQQESDLLGRRIAVRLQQ